MTSRAAIFQQEGQGQFVMVTKGLTQRDHSPMDSALHTNKQHFISMARSIGTARFFFFFWLLCVVDGILVP